MHPLTQCVAFDARYCGAQVDDSGAIKVLQLDDHEASLLSMWLRTGLWLRPELAARLNIQRLHVCGHDRGIPHCRHGLLCMWLRILERCVQCGRRRKDAAAE